MSITNTQLKTAIEQGMRRNLNWNNSEIVSIECEDMSVYGMSANKFQSCKVAVIADNREQSVDLVIKKWVPGGITDVDLWLEPQPREFLAFEAGIFSPDSMPAQIDVPLIGVFKDAKSNDYMMVLRDITEQLTPFRFESDLPEIHRKYSAALDKLALMHAAWEKPEYQARLGKPNWLVSDSMRLSRSELLTRYLEGFTISESDLSKIERIKGWIKGARIQEARDSFYNTLSESDAALWKRHETNRTRLIAEFSRYPKTLVHGDFWPLNIGLQTANGDEKMILIDWEWIGSGCSSLDVAKLLSAGAALDYADFDSQKLSDHYFERYVAHGGTQYDFNTWKQAYELAEVYHALIVHSLATGWAILDNSEQRECREARTPRLTELIVRYLG